ncbi:uncharacterized protein PSFLO_07079 [Pseudozyma flocculosa]|uniref:Uncharacterized protein n=1 Tax=Pseudozyma flocculosa TaxID=84751 RepID=A0A5C3FD88_9BASI|nr:uncharacterized protein PSFLO_07079 [Pseudozyma flocculosa]
MRTSLASLSVLLAFPLTAIGAGSDQGLKPFRWVRIGRPGQGVGHIEISQAGQGAFIRLRLDARIQGAPADPSVKLLDYTNPGKPGVVFSDPAGTGASGTTHNCQASTSMVKLCEWIAGEGPHTDYRLNGTCSMLNRVPDRERLSYRRLMPASSLDPRGAIPWAVGTYTGVNEYPVTRNFAFRGGIP